MDGAVTVYTPWQVHMCHITKGNTTYDQYRDCLACPHSSPDLSKSDHLLIKSLRTPLGKVRL